MILWPLGGSRNTTEPAVALKSFFFLLKTAAYEGGQNKPKTLNLWAVKVKTMLLIVILC